MDVKNAVAVKVKKPPPWWIEQEEEGRRGRRNFTEKQQLVLPFTSWTG
jgi:hypothetical protein